MFSSGSRHVARFLGALGVAMEDAGTGADGSPLDVAALHREILGRACPLGEPGVRRWGWTESEQLDQAVVAEADALAGAYAAARRDAAAGAWGFAEPRATLLLDLWMRVLPDAVVVLPYRAPWDVVADVLALDLPEFAERPDYAARVWLRYARAQIAFASNRPDDVLVVDAAAFAAAPGVFSARLAALVGDDVGALHDGALVALAATEMGAVGTLDAGGSLARLVRTTAREVAAAHEQLQRLAGVPPKRPAAPVVGPPPPADTEALAVERLGLWLTATVRELDTALTTRDCAAAPGGPPAGAVEPAPPSGSPATPGVPRSRARPLSLTRGGRWRRVRPSDGRGGDAGRRDGTSEPVALAEPEPQPEPEPRPEPDPAERWFREHHGEAADKTLAFLAAGGVVLEGRDVADIGSGDGIIDLALVQKGAPRRLVGFDLRRTNSEHLLEQARRYGVADELPEALSFEESQTVGIPAPDDSFDVAISWSAFEHISEPVGVATEIRRILRPGGVLFLQLWPFYRSEKGSHLWDWFARPHHHLLEHEDDIVERMLASDVHEPGFTRYMADEFKHLNRITIEELHRALLAAGFHVARLELMTHTVQIPPALGRYPLTDLAVGGVQLLAQ